MDDLDHSMHIAEEDWSNFCQESEECCVPQPLLACPKGLRCSDRSVPATQSPQSLEENRTTCVKLELIQDVVEEDTAEDNKAQICNDTGIPLFSQEVPVTEERIPEETQKSIVQTPEVNDVARSLPTECDTKVSCLAQSGSEFPLREKERWFVTLSLNDSPVSRRASATPREKKAPLKKKWCRPRREPQHNESAVNKNINATPNQNRSKERVGQKTSCGSVQNVSMETRHDGDIERNNRQRPEDITQDREDGTIQDIQQNRQERTLHVDIVQNKKEETLYDGDRTTHQDDSMRQDKIEATLNGDERTQTKSKRTFCVDHTTRQDNVEESPQGDDMVQNNNEGALYDDDALQNDIEGTPHDIFPLERVDSDEFVDSVEFFTLPSSGSELYLSASESVAQDLFEEDSVENQPRECLSYSSLSLPHNCDPIQSSGVRSLQARESDDNGGGSDKAFVEPTWVFPPLMGQRGATPPDESSTQQKADLPRVQTEPHPTACGVDGPRSVPDVIVTPVADGPEAYAQATGRAPCVYAISDFWDEMEKLTINDILQLRMTRSPPSTETSDVPSQSGSLVDPDELHLTDGGLTDVSDAADSDYFTQPDDSKVDRSSWDFSVCDFEDDYWQFLGMSRNPSPDLSCKIQREEEEEEGATGIQTPVPVEDSARQNPMPRAMMKNKSVQNIRALNTEDLSLQSHLHNDDEKSKRDSLGPVVAAPLQGDDLEFFPESFITEGTGNRNVIFVYDPEGTSHAPGYNDMICTCDHKMFFPTQSHKWKPIPIFSCSYPTIRELPLLKRNDPFLSVDFLEEDVISPVRIISRALRVAEYQSGRSLLPFGKIRFQDKGSIWYRRSDGWELPTQSEEGGVAVPTVGGVSLQELEQQRIVGTMQRPVRVGVLSALQQSDMCLVCIAFASWVLASSDPESADAWKAAVLANVSALSAIQYLRQTK